MCKVGLVTKLRLSTCLPLDETVGHDMSPCMAGLVSLTLKLTLPMFQDTGHGADLGCISVLSSIATLHELAVRPDNDVIDFCPDVDEREASSLLHGLSAVRQLRCRTSFLARPEPDSETNKAFAMMLRRLVNVEVLSARFGPSCISLVDSSARSWRKRATEELVVDSLERAVEI